MSRTRFFTTVAAVLALHVAVQAQDLTVTGTVTDGSSGEPVPFASIQVKGTLTGGSADTDKTITKEITVNQAAGSGQGSNMHWIYSQVQAMFLSVLLFITQITCLLTGL